MNCQRTGRLPAAPSAGKAVSGQPLSPAPVLPGDVDQHVQPVSDDLPGLVENVFVHVHGHHLAEEEVVIARCLPRVLCRRTPIGHSILLYAQICAKVQFWGLKLHFCAPKCNFGYADWSWSWMMSIGLLIHRLVFETLFEMLRQ